METPRKYAGTPSALIDAGFRVHVERRKLDVYTTRQVPLRSTRKRTMNNPRGKDRSRSLYMDEME